MDTKSQTETIQLAIGSGAMTPNEARQKLDLPPVKGGANCYLQQQNFSLEALAKRDAKEDPFASAKPPATAKPKPKPEGEPGDAGEQERRQQYVAFHKGFYGAPVN